MNEKKSCAVEWLGHYLDKLLNVQVRDDASYTRYYLSNVYADGTLELITLAEDDEEEKVYVEFVNVDNILKIALSIDDTDIKLKE